MAVESIGPIFETKIPSLTDAADIQAAFYAYHYGAYTSISTTAAIITPSIAKILLDFETDIVALQAQPASGGASTSDAPVDANFAGGIPNGFIWVDEDGAVTNSVIGATSIFTDNAPTSNITSGIIWVDKDATTSTTGNPFIPQAIIAAKGDLLAGSANDNVVVLTVGSNGTYLKADSSTASGLAWAAAGDVTLTGTQTLTNKTLTSPVLGGTTTTASGNLVVQPASYVLEVQGGGSTDGAIQLNCYVNSHGQKIKSQPHSASATNTLLLPGGNTIGNGNSVLVSEIGTQTLTNKTLTSPILISPEERLSVSATTSTGTINFDLATAGTLFHTANAAANHTLNFRFSSSTSLNNMLTTNDSVTAVFMNTNGATAYYPSLITVDGATSAVSVKYQGGTAFAAGNASSVDAYVFNIIKTAATSYTVLASQTKFA